ncbi:Rne/Rng family ribonuclease [Dermacoccus barathri]|uniref:Rne/Rng family ribonuclease n=1 Tax=Dermacoccus barathri TaxID=322601 RepID=UPI00187A578B|nr:Rne/Rng family ribonuclease [Dermacoccus barathri]MBE7371109.1 Rne/Rng family ribonuclease [Dermacoccus barathri]
MAPENNDETTFASPFFAGSPFASQQAPKTPEVDETEEADTTDEAAAAPAPGAAFGLLFQAPDPQKRAPKRERVPREDERDGASASDDDAESRSDDGDDGDDTSRGNRGRGGRRGSRDGNNDRRDSSANSVAAGDGDADDVNASGDDDTDDNDDDQTPRRRRRGGRGRRSNSSKNSGDSGDSNNSGDKNSNESNGSDNGKNAERDGDANEDDTSDNASNDSDNGDDDSNDSGSRKRTRRRRRSGSGGSDSDDPNTVTRVREPRKAKDEVTSIKGSTRLEAKKQRRREGREAGRRRTVITEAEFLARRESVERVMVVREREGRTQIGVLEDGVLAEHYVSRQEQASSMAGNVYLGRVQNVLPSMEAAFIDIGRGRNAVLYAGEVNWDAAGLDNQPKRIEHALKAGESVLVQVTKDPIGHKGARLTSQISLPGRFLVYVPGNSMTGISRKLPDVERARLKKILKEVVPADAGVIVRTAAEGASEEELRADVERLTKMWERIQKKAESGNAPVLVHGEPDLTVRVIRDVFNEDFAKMVVSGDRAWNEVHSYISEVAPDLTERLEKWTGEKDVFAKHRIDEQLAKAMDRKVWLPSGGSLVIDRTEAMTVVDVNTGKFVGSGGNLEETVTKNNIEAAEEIVRQLRLRDIGGIIVVDFIDMVLESNRELVVRRLLECLGRDRTKHQVAEVTSLGLVQMTRKRVGSGLVEVFSEQCESCHGRGIIVHDHPVENRDINGNDTSRKGRGSRRGGNGNGGSNNGGNNGNTSGGSNSNSNDSSHDKKGDERDNGFAQIAAAAHAAAISAGDKSATSEPVSTTSSEDAVVSEKDAATKTAAPERTTVRENVGHVESSSSTSTKSAPQEHGKAPARRRGSRRAATSTGAPTAAGEATVMTVQASTTTSDAPAAAAASPETPADAPNVAADSAPTQAEAPVVTQEATAAAKRLRRAASSSGAPVSLQAVDLAAAPMSSAPLTKVAGEASDAAGSAQSAPAQAAVTSETKAPARKKRTRVVAPAGAPGTKADEA